MTVEHILETIVRTGNAFCPFTSRNELMALAAVRGIVLYGGIIFTKDDPHNPLHENCQCYYINR